MFKSEINILSFARLQRVRHQLLLNNHSENGLFHLFSKQFFPECVLTKFITMLGNSKFLSYKMFAKLQRQIFLFVILSFCYILGALFWYIPWVLPAELPLHEKFLNTIYFWQIRQEVEMCIGVAWVSLM